MTEELNNTPVTTPAEAAKKKRLAEIAARRAEIAAARERRDEEREADETVARAERQLVDDVAIEAAELKHGPIGKMIAVIETPIGAIVIKRPHAATFKRFQDRESKKTKDVEDFVMPCRVHPERAEFDQILEQLPGTLARCANAAAKLAGARVEEVSEK